jgi:hypothetical protein
LLVRVSAAIKTGRMSQIARDAKESARLLWCFALTNAQVLAKPKYPLGHRSSVVLRASPMLKYPANEAKPTAHIVEESRRAQ